MLRSIDVHMIQAGSVGWASYFLNKLVQTKAGGISSKTVINVVVTQYVYVYVS